MLKPSESTSGVPVSMRPRCCHVTPSSDDAPHDRRLAGAGKADV